MDEPSFVLLHSPLVGTYTWQAVARYLREQGYHVLVPDLLDDDSSAIPYWRQELSHLDLPSSEFILVGHSGAGALLSAITENRRVRAFIFVDAVLLLKSATRLDLLYAENVEFAKSFEDFLKTGGQFPNWQDEQLEAIIPDNDMRQKLLADLRPRSLDFFTEMIDPSPAWDTKPCAYIQLSETYDYYARQAESRNWLVLRHESHHFEMLTNPTKIARMLIQIKEQLLS